MGIAELAASVARKAAPPTGPATAALRSRQLWREVFGRGPQMVNKEDPRPYGSPAPTPGGTYARSIAASGEASFKRLLQAMRSMAPGGWSDDRWSQTNAYTGMAYVAIHGKCRIKSQAEFQVFKKDPENPDGKRPIREDEPGYELVKLLERPNPQDSFGDLMFRWGQQTDLTGMALTWMVPNKLGTPMELYPIPTAIAIPQPAVNPDYPDGYWRIQPVYPYGPFSTYPTPSSAVGAAIPAQWMLRFLEPHPMLRYDGYSPMSGMRLHIDEINMMDRSRHYSMRRATNPSAVLDLSGMDDAQPLNDDAIDRMLAEFANTMQGPENAGSLLIPPPGGKIEPWGAAPVDMDYQSGWDQLASFILGGFGITKPAAGMVEDSSYASLYATLKQLHLVTLQPECVSEKTPLITREGAGPIGEYVDKTVEVWNGKRWSPVTVRKTGSDKQLLRVRFSDGSYLDCTPNHRFSVSTKNDRKWRTVEAKDLRLGMGTETFSIQHNEGKVLRDAYTLGVLFGDGQVEKDGTTTVDLYGEKALLPVSGEKSKEWHDPRCKVPYVHAKCGEHHFKRLGSLRTDDENAWWEMFSFDRESILSFLAGWFDTDGNKCSGTSIRLSVSGRFRADMVQLLLTKCGIRSTVYLMARAGEVTNYGRRSADLWAVFVADCADIPCHRLDTSGGRTPPRKGKYQTVKSIEWLPGLHDTYCFTEMEEHKGVFNNTLTHQCDIIAAQLTRHLAPFFGDDLIVEIRCKRVDDHDVKANKLGQLIQAKAITKNELRKELDMPLTEEEWGEEIAGTEKQEGGAPGMPGMPAPGGEGGNPMEGLMNAAKKESEEPQEPKSPEEKERPRTEELGKGSRGPRDHEARMVLPKSLHKRAKHLLNGSSNGHSNGVATLPAKKTKSLYDEIREKLS